MLTLTQSKSGAHRRVSPAPPDGRRASPRSADGGPGLGPARIDVDPENRHASPEISGGGLAFGKEDESPELGSSLNRSQRGNCSTEYNTPLRHLSRLRTIPSPDIELPRYGAPNGTAAVPPRTGGKIPPTSDAVETPPTGLWRRPGFPGTPSKVTLFRAFRLTGLLVGIIAS
ncbi:hypothetical protein AAG570_004824 [Ranatra chinensis]|uniref:Uncharacterized protein n=1 Tax=Ranatra chinensis TaxID=642074 RepID=A0ABD0XYM4_9HEMI